MFPVGGVGVMLLAALAAGVACLGAGLLLGRALAGRSPGAPWAGRVAGVSVGLFCWSLAVIAIVTLIPAEGAPGWVSAESRLEGCSWDIGGPAPDGFWIFSGGQRLLNTVLFVPAGALLVLAVARWRAGWVLAPLGLLGLAAYSALIEKVQLEVARIDRACDVTDIVDNVTGAVFGFAAGLVLALVLRPWRR